MNIIESECTSLLAVRFSMSASSPTSSLTPTAKSPIDTLPYDVLYEIFTQCLLIYPLHQRYPRTQTAPMLLCHICSSWQRLALASPTLWTHLSYSSTLVKRHEQGFDSSPASPTSALDFIEGDIEFFRWLKTNQAQIPPFLSLDLDKPTTSDSTRKLTTSSIAFLLEYLTSAQYLELNIFYWSWICHQLQVGYAVVFPNLHTVLVERRWTEHDPFRELQTLLPAHAFPALRRLSTKLKFAKDFTQPPGWSTLTHVSLQISTALEFWLPFLRSVPQLRWAYFDVVVSSTFTVTDHTPSLPNCTLLHLDTLSIAVRGGLDRNLRSPLSLLFKGLHLPSVHTLALSAPRMKAWEDRSALRELYCVLASTPAVTKLALEDKGPHPQGPQGNLLFPVFAHSVLGDPEPIWLHAPALAHLELTCPAAGAGEEAQREARREAMLALYVHRVFSPDSTWLDLGNPASPIRAVTISNAFRVSDLTMLNIRDDARSVPKVVFEMTGWSAGQLAADEKNKWGRRFTSF